MSASPLDLLQGTLDVLVLKTLSWEPMHGYAVSRWIRQRTEGVLAIEDAALYQALHRLERKGLIAAEWGLSENNRRAKYYHLTADGRKALRAEVSSWQRYARAVALVLEPAG
jgi:PadR family transcriptional regulator PadR